MTLYAAATGFENSPVHPVGVMLGVVVTLLFAFHGWTFLAWRVPGVFGASRAGRSLVVSAVVAALPAVGVLAGAMPYLLEHSASPATLNVLSVMALPFAPVMLGAQVWVWRTFRPGKDAVPLPSFF
jgi:cytochrome bd-type quinol oxidase subunit 2